MNKLNKTISVIIPCFNEETNINKITQQIVLQFKKSKYLYEIIFIDDGSHDNTLNAIKLQQKKNHHISYISFSRNFGHQAALKAGLDYAHGDCVISMDADLQHPPKLIPQMLLKWQQGFNVIYTVRIDKSVGIFKKITSKLFYSLINHLCENRIEYGSADFRLLDRKVVNIIKQMNENDLFLRGAISWVGFKQCSIPYIPANRFSGTSKYSLKKMVNLALSGVTGFSIKPLRFTTYVGYVISFFAFIYGLYAIIVEIFTSNNISGWTSLLVTMTFLSGIQMITMGIFGEYLGKLFINEKKRPNYIITETNKELL